MTINQQQVTAREGETILEVAKRNHIQIPTLCHLEGIHQIGACRICVVEVEGAKSLMASCVTPGKRPAWWCAPHAQGPQGRARSCTS